MANFLKSGQGIQDVSRSSGTSLDANVELLKKYGLYKEPPKPKLGVLSRIGLLLNTFSPTTAAYKSLYQKKDFGTEYGKTIVGSLKGGFTGEIDNEFMNSQKSGKDILVKEGMQDTKGAIDFADVAGLGVDILTDPTTYLTSGLAKGGTKIFGTGGKAVNLSKTGTKGLEEFIRTSGAGMTRDAAEKVFAETALQTPKYLAKRGIRLAGQTVIPGSALDKIGLQQVADKGIVAGGLGSVVKGAENLPLVGSRIKKNVTTPIKSLFDPMAEIKAALPEQADYISTTINNFNRSKGAQKELFAERLLEIAKKANKIDPNAGTLINRATEGGMGVVPKVDQIIEPDAVEGLTKAKGLNPEDVVEKGADINTRRAIPVKDIYGNKREIPAGEALTPYQLKGNKVLLQDGESYILPKNQYDNVRGNSIVGEGKPFAPELEGTVPVVKDSAFKWKKSASEKATRWGTDVKYDVVRLEQNPNITIRHTDGITEILDEGEEVRTFHNDDIPMAKMYAEEYASELTTANKLPLMDRITKYKNYSDARGKNYKETLITRPVEAPKTDSETIFRELGLPGRIGDNTDAINQERIRRLTDSFGKSHSNAHWDEDNVIAHIRNNERTYKGQKLYFLEELQSDWARDVRKKGVKGKITELPKGYSVKPRPQSYRDEMARLMPNDRAKDEMFYVANEAGHPLTGGATEEEAISRALSMLGVVDDPLLKNWQEVSIKKSLKDAVDSNAKYFSWISGKQTADRYNLAKDIDNIKWEPTAPGSVMGDFTVQPTMVGRNTPMTTMGVTKDGKIVGGLPEHVGKNLYEVLGKGLAEKIMAKSSGVLREDGLRLGGEWAENLYDKQLPNLVKKLTGEEPKIITLGGSKQMAIEITPEVRAKILGEAPPIKPASGADPFRVVTKKPAEEVSTMTTKEVGKALGKKKAEITKLAEKRDEILAKLPQTVEGQKKHKATVTMYKAKGEKLLAEKRVLEEQYAKLKQNRAPLGVFPEAKPMEGPVIRGDVATPIKTTGNAELDKVQAEMKSILKETYDDDVKNGLVTTGEIENYTHRMYTKEAQDYINRTGYTYNGSKELKTEISAGKSRMSNAQYIDTINADFKKQTGNDFNLIDDDIFRSTLKRKFDSIEAGSNVKLNQTINKELGVGADELTQDGKFGGMHYVESTYQPGVYIPKEVNDAMNKIRNMSDDKSLNTFLNMYDKGLKFWKGSVTRYFPSFHVRNFMGATFNNWLAGVDNPMRYTQVINIMKTKKPGYVVTKGGTRMSYDEIRKMVKESGILGQTGMFDVQRNFADVTSGMGKRNIGQKIYAPVKEASDKVFTSVEDEVRATLFLDRILKGDSVSQATDQVFKYHFDYSPQAYTHFENSVLKRIAPFYSWTKGNIPLQLEQLGKQPGKYAAIFKIKNMFDYESGDRAKANEENSLLPENMKEQFTFKIPGSKGQTIQVPIPMEDLARMKPKEAYAMLAPFIKMPFELASNKNIYMDQEIANKALPKDMQTVKTIIDPKYVTKPVQDFFNLQETTIEDPVTGEPKKQFEMDATKMYWIRSLAGRFYSTVEDATTKEKGDAAKMLKYLSGLNPKTTDMDKQEYYAALDDNAQMSEVVKYFRKKGAMPSAEAEKASTKKYKPMKATKKFTTKTSTAKSKSQKAKDLIASSKKRKEQK